MKGLVVLLFFLGALAAEKDDAQWRTAIDAQLRTLNVVMTRFVTGPLREDVSPASFQNRNATAILERQVMEFRAQVAHEMEWTLEQRVHVRPLRESISTDAMDAVVRELRKRGFQAVRMDRGVVVDWSE